MSRREKVKVVKFVPVKKVFKPMVGIRLLVDVNGWADRERGLKWHMAAGTTEIIDKDKAREFVAKGYAEFTDPEAQQTISDDERAEHMSTVTQLTPGGEDGNG